MMRPTATLLLAALSALALPACLDEEAVPVKPVCGEGPMQGAIITALAFTREEPKGVAPGFDLDRHVSTQSDESSCHKKDFVDAEGNPGVDNQLASVVTDIEAVVGDAVGGLVQGAIDNGELMILLKMEGATSLQDQACVNLSVQLGKGRPSIGTDGVIEAYQTFSLDAESTPNHVEGGRIEKGVFSAGPLDLAIPLALFDVAFTLHVHNTMFRFTIDEEAAKMTGYFGGGIDVEELLAGVSQGAGVDKLLPVLRPTLSDAADLARDEKTGKCKQLSATLSFNAAPAFIRE